MEGEGGPVQPVLLDEAEHVGNPSVRVFLAGAQVRADLANQQGKALRQHQHLLLPVAFPGINVRGVDDAVPTRVLQFQLRRDPGQVVGPVQPARHQQVFRSGGAGGLDQSLHAHRDKLLAIDFHRTAVSPSLPAGAVGLVEEVEHHRWMILVPGGGVLPKAGVRLGGRAEAVQVQQDIRPAIGGEGNHVVHHRAIVLAAVGLPLGLAKPGVLFHRQADGVGPPVLDGDQGRFQHLLPLHGELQANHIDALEEHGLAGGVQQPISLHMQGFGPAGGVWLFRLDPRGPLAGFALHRLRPQRGGVDRLEHQVVQIEDSALHLEERGHEFQGHGSGGQQEGGAPFLPALGVFPGVGRGGRRLEFLAGSVLGFQENAGVKPGLFARLQAGHPLPPGQFQRLRARGDGHGLVEHDQSAGRGRGEAQEVISLLHLPAPALLGPPPPIGPPVGLGVLLQRAVWQKRMGVSPQRTKRLNPGNQGHEGKSCGSVHACGFRASRAAVQWK